MLFGNYVLGIFKTGIPIYNLHSLELNEQKIRMNEIVLMYGYLWNYVCILYFRVLDLELKKEAVVKAVCRRNNAADDDSEASSADEVEFDEYLDWRAKKSYK